MCVSHMYPAGSKRHGAAPPAVQEPRAVNRRNAAILLGVVAAVGLGSWLLVGRRPHLPAAPLARAPHGSTAVGWIDVGAVLSSRLWERVVESHGGDEGIRRIERTCGFDPLAQIDDVVLFATGDEPEALERVGVVARGRLDHEALAACVGEVVQADGGEVRRVEIAGVPAVAGRGQSRAAFVGADGVVAGSEATVRDVVGVVRDGARAASDDPALGRLWERVAGGRHVVLVGHLPAHWREAIRRMARDAERGSLASLAGARSFGVGVRVTRGLGVGVALEMRDAAQAREAEAAVRAEIERTLDDPMTSLSALAPALRRIDAEAQDRDLILTLSLSDSQLDDLVELGEDLWEQAGERERRRGARRALPPPEPDEVLRPE